MKQMGRKHRHYYRIVAIDGRQPRDGRVIEELGTYDPHVKVKENRVTLIPSRIEYWLSVGAQPSEHVVAIMKKFMEKWKVKEAEAAAAASAAPATATATTGA
jgi:small subunit ribosomal protein S16